MDAKLFESHRSQEAQRHLKLLGSAATEAMTDTELRQRGKAVGVEAGIFCKWHRDFVRYGVNGLKPDWPKITDEECQAALELYEKIKDVADEEFLTLQNIQSAAEKNGWSKGRAERTIRRYRAEGLWALVPGNKARHSKVHDVATLSNKQLERIEKKYKIIQSQAEKETITEEEVAKLAEENNVSPRQVRYLIERFRKHQRAGLARKQRSDKGTHRGVSERMTKIIQGIRLSQPDIPSHKVHKIAKEKAQALGERVPRPGQVRAICSEIPRPIRLLADKREDEFRSHYRFTHKMDFGNRSVLQIDSTLVDVLVKDLRKKRTRKKSGEIRPWLTLAIHNSRLVMAAIFSYDRPDRFTVGAVIRDSILKSEEKPYGGKPDEIWVDNGKEFISNYIVQLSQELKIVLFDCPPHNPQLKGIVERFFGVLNTRLWSTLPGYVDSNTTERNPNAHATLTIRDVKQKFWEFTESYHNEPHSTLGVTPLQYWQENFYGEPVDPRTLDILLMEPIRRKVIKTGIKHYGRLYTHPSLAVIVGQHVLVRAEPPYKYPDWIEVFHDGKWLCSAFATDSETGKRFNQAQIAEAQAAQKAKINADIEQARAAIQEANNDIEELKSKDTSPKSAEPKAPKANKTKTKNKNIKPDAPRDIYDRGFGQNSEQEA